MKRKISITIDEKILEGIDSVVDNIFIRNRSQAIEHLVKNSLGENKKAVILSGGPEKPIMISEGEFRITANIKGVTLIERAVKKLRENGFKEIFLVAGHTVLTKVFDVLKDGTSYGVKMHYVEEKESRGTAYSLRLLKGRIETSFLVVYGDILFDKINLDELWNQHLKQDSIVTLLLTTSATPSEKGTVKMQGSKILEFIQKPKRSDVYLVFSAIFAAHSEVFEFPGDSLEYEVFPLLAKRGLLEGHISPEKEIHIHSKEDVKRLS